MSADPAAIARVALLELARTDGVSRWIDAHGPSMAPTIPPGSRLLVAFGRQPTRIGEVLVVRDGERLVAHRFVARRQVAGRTTFVVKGDAEPLADAPVEPEAVLGVVRAVELPAGTRALALVAGRRAAAIGRASWLGDRLGRMGRRLARPLPHPLQRAAVRIALPMSRVPTRVLLATLLRLDRRPFAGRR